MEEHISDIAINNDFPLQTKAGNHSHPNAVYDDNYLLKRGIWLYFFLLIFEGALRKWFLPALATPLLIVRDPIAIWLVYSAWRKNIIHSNFYLNGAVLIGVIGTYLAIFVGHGNVAVALYGARTLLFHFPMMYVIGQVFNREDVIKLGKATLLLSIPMVLLIGLQFYSPQSAWVNRGIGGDIAGAGFGGTGDFFRPPGTFSFTNGVGLFFGFLAPFVFYFWLSKTNVNKLILIGATGAMLASVPFSISRALLFEVVLSLVFALIAALRKPEYLNKIIFAVVVGIVVLAGLSHTHFFQTATGAFTDRFDTANEVEGGLVKGVIGDRFFGGLFSAIRDSGNQPFFGYGIGMGTNVGSILLSGKQTFLIAEAEWARDIGELGPYLGLLLIFLRVGLSFKLAFASYRKMLTGDLMPWMLLSFGFINIAQLGWSQPTSLGFFVMTGGLMLASLNDQNAIAPKSVQQQIPQY